MVGEFKVLIIICCQVSQIIYKQTKDTFHNCIIYKIDLHKKKDFSLLLPNRTFLKNSHSTPNMVEKVLLKNRANCHHFKL